MGGVENGHFSFFAVPIRKRVFEILGVAFEVQEWKGSKMDV